MPITRGSCGGERIATSFIKSLILFSFPVAEYGLPQKSFDLSFFFFVVLGVECGGAVSALQAPHSPQKSFGLSFFVVLGVECGGAVSALQAPHSPQKSFGLSFFVVLGVECGGAVSALQAPHSPQKSFGLSFFVVLGVECGGAVSAFQAPHSPQKSFGLSSFFCSFGGGVWWGCFCPPGSTLPPEIV